MRRRRRLKKNKVSILETIPSDMVSEILSRVGSKSLTSIMTVKLSSKKLKEAAEEKLVYQRVTLEGLPMVSWKPVDQNQKIFLYKCQLFGNPEAIYRQAVMDYFNKVDMISACKNLLKAMKAGHLGALYVTCIVLLFSADEDLKQNGIKIIGEMKRMMKRTFIKCRNNLMRELDRMWVKNEILKKRPVCCTTKHPTTEHWQKDRWVYDEEEKCKACSADREIGLISGTYNYG